MDIVASVMVVFILVVNMLVVLMVVLLLWRRKRSLKNAKLKVAGNGIDLSNPNYNSCKIILILLRLLSYRYILSSSHAQSYKVNT